MLCNLDNESWISRFVNISYLQSYSNINEVVIDGVAEQIPQIQIQRVEVDPSIVKGWYGNNNEAPVALTVQVSNTSSILFLNIWPLMTNLIGNDINDGYWQIRDAIKLCYTKIVGLSSIYSDYRRFYLKNRGYIQLDGKFSFQDYNLHTLEINGTIYRDMEVTGTITLRSCVFGYFFIQLSGYIKYFEDGVFKSEVISNNQTYLIRNLSINGTGIAKFDAITSGKPFSLTYTNQFYVTQGNISFTALAFSNDFSLIAPCQLSEFGG